MPQCANSAAFAEAMSLGHVMERAAVKKHAPRPLLQPVLPANLAGSLSTLRILGHHLQAAQAPGRAVPSLSTAGASGGAHQPLSKVLQTLPSHVAGWGAVGKAKQGQAALSKAGRQEPHRGACKVSFTSPALQTQEHGVQGHLVKINKAGPRPEHEVEQRLAERGHSLDAAVQPPALHGKGPRLYVGGIAEDLGEEKIRQVSW